MKILITGMSGFVGAAITKALYHTDHELIGLVRDKNDLPDQIRDKYTIIKSDISKKVPEIECDLVIHTAATVSEKVLSLIMNKTNVEGTRRVLEATPSSSKIIYISSASVYNVTEKIHVENETIDAKLLTPYGRSKYLSEQIILTEFKDRDAIILRPRAIYGKGDKVILPRLISIYKDGKIKVPGNLNQQASMTHIDFFVDAVLACVNHNFSGQEIINVTDYHVYNLRENITHLFQEIFKKPIQIKELNEHFVRIIAGLRTVLIPGNQFTQTSIDYLTRDHVLSAEKLQRTFPHLKSPHFKEVIPDYVTWINNIGLSNIAARNKRIVWM